MDDNNPSIERSAEALDHITKEKPMHEQPPVAIVAAGVRTSGKVRLKITRASDVKRGAAGSTP